jgi:hypothetical protein
MASVQVQFLQCMAFDHNLATCLDKAPMMGEAKKKKGVNGTTSKYNLHNKF